MKRILRALFVAGLGGLLFFSLRPSYTNGSRTRGLPHALADWINGHDTLANFLAYAGMGLLAFSLAPTRSKEDGSAGLAQRAPGMVSLGMGAMVCLIELAQLWIPGRVCDSSDILAAWGGLIAASFSAEAWRKISSNRRQFTTNDNQNKSVAAWR